jgi:hypothetical protein
MEALKETPKTAASVLFTGVGTRQVAGRTAAAPPSSRGLKTNPKLRRHEEIFAWIGIAAIWVTFAFSLFLIWTKASGGL